MVKDAVKIRAIDKDDLHAAIKSNIERHKKVGNAIEAFSPKEIQELYSRYTSIIKDYPKLTTNKIHEQYYKELIGKAKMDENKFFMNSLFSANEDFYKILTDIDKNLDKLIEDKELTLQNVRMTSISVLGILRQSNVLLNFTMFMWSQFVKAVSGGDLNDIPKYRNNYLVNNLKQVTTTVNNVRDKKGPYMFLEEASEIKKKNADLLLGASTTGGSNFLNIFNPNSYTRGFIDNLETLLSTLNIFRWSQEKYEDWKHENYLADKETLSWMEQHVTILRYELSNIDKNDPKYQTIMKIVDAYDSRISSYHQKINDYENGE